MNNNVNKTTENIVNDNAVYNIVNQVVKCDCTKHNPSDPDCFCDSCIQEQSERLDWFISMKNPAEGQLRGIRTMIIGEDDSETGLVWGWELVPEEGEPALFTGGQWMSLKALIKGEQK